MFANPSMGMAFAGSEFKGIVLELCRVAGIELEEYAS